MPRSSRRASKRPRQLSPRQVRRPRVRQQQLKQPVRLRQRNLPPERQRLPVGQPNLLLRPRLLLKFVGFPVREVFSRDSPGEDFCCTNALLREAPCARNSTSRNPSSSETRSWRFAMESCKVNNQWCPWDVRSLFQKRVA